MSINEEPIIYGYVYKIVNTVNQKIYVGVTKKTVEDRWNSHINAAYNYRCKDYNALFKKAIRKYGVESFEVSTLEEGITTIEELKAREIYWIDKLKSYAFDEENWGYNSTRGGDYPYEPMMTPVSQFDVLTGKLIANYPSIVFAQEVIGKKVDYIGQKGRTSGGYCFLYTKDIEGLNEDELVDFVHSLYPYLVYKLDENGKILDVFFNTAQAAESVGSNNSGNIISCCLGTRRLAKGFQWCYQQDLEKRVGKPPRDIKTGKIRVRQYGLNGKYIKTFSSIQEACEKSGALDSHVSQCCKGNRQTAGGFQWRYDKDNIESLSQIFTKRPVICIETKEEFPTCNHAAKHFGYAQQTVKKSCKGYKIQKPYSFMFLDDYKENHS